LPDFKLILPTEELVYCEVNHSEADDWWCPYSIERLAGSF